MKEGPILWLDLEMTGLEPHKESIIEIATLVTDSQLEILATGPQLVIHQSDRLLEAMDDWNQEHHRASGLYEEVQRSSLTTGDAERLTLEFVSKHCPRHASPLAGNSIYMDRLFLRYYMPDFHNWMHYRLIDVSSIKELAQRWYPEVFRQRPNKEGNHRAHDDILESIAELKFYREHIFKPLT